MKINKVKSLVGTMAIAAVAATVGSISGTVAWFQYSTRATAAYHGAAAHCTENLEIRIRSTNGTIGAWKHDLTTADITTYLSTNTAGGGANRDTAANTLRPVTSGDLALGEVPSELYKNPIYQYADMSTWGVATATEDYVLLPLELRVEDLDGDASADYLAKKIWISDITIEAQADRADPAYTASEHTDLSSAIRVAVSAGQSGSAKTAYATFAMDPADVTVSGKLDLNDDGEDDKVAGYDFQDDRADVVYGYPSGAHVAKSTTTLASAGSGKKGIADDSDPYTIDETEIGSTTTEKTLEVDVMIYLEGWKQLGSPASAIWDIGETVGAEFNVGIRFSAETHAATGE